MKSPFLFIPLLFLCCFISLSSYGQNQDNENYSDSLNTILENLSWKELDSIGKLYGEQAKFGLSEKYLKKAEIVAQELQGKDSLYANSHANLGQIYAYQGKYDKAEQILSEAKDMQEKVLGKNNPKYALTTDNLATVFWYKGMYKKAEELYTEVKIIRKNILGENHPDYATSLSNLGAIYYSQGLYDKAEPLLLEALNIWSNSIGKENPDYALTRNNLGSLYFMKGWYVKSEASYLEANTIWKTIYGSEHPDYATSCHNLANVYMSQGLLQKAKSFYIKTKNIYAKTVGKETSYYATTCASLAKIYQKESNYSEAKLLYFEAKNIHEKTLGKKHPKYAGTCINLGVLYQGEKQYEKAENLYLEAKEIWQETFGKEHIDYSNVCTALASLYHVQELYSKAEPLYKEANKIDKNVLGEQHPQYAKSSMYLADLYFKINKYQEAKQFYIQSLENKRQQIQKLLTNLSEQERQKYVSSIEIYFNHFTTFAIDFYPQNKKITQALFNYQLFTKGIVFSSTQKMKEQILNSKDSVLINQYEDWKKQKEEYVALFQTPISKRDSSINIEEIASQINELEREISKKSELFKSNTDQKEYTWQDVKNSIDKNEAAIEIIRLVRLNNQEKPKDTVYVALILTDKTKESPELLVLENGQELENGALNFYQNNIDFQLGDNESYNQYWKPIQDKLDSLSNKKSYSKIYFSPDGVYHKLNLNTLKNPKTKEFLVEEQNIQLITSSRDLVKRNEKGKQKVDLNKNFADYKTYLLGYPAYNLNGKDTLKVNGEDRSLNGLQRVVGQQTVVPVLEGTKVETNEINELFAEKNVKTTLLQNKEATEENIKELENPTILHIATHGFFINQIPESEVTTMQEAEDRNLLQNPFLRSGLLLAGCQNPQIGQEDGILSAEEAMNLNLDGTELVVLSACETGLGDIQNGEGVYGLQRAFRQAGAKTLIMSLWKVSDEATQLLMVTFYKEFLSGKSKREAFKIAQLKLKEKYSEPYYWGAFVMVGE